LHGINGEGAPDVIFLDLNMPESDGFSFLQSFIALPEKIKTKSKIVVLTSSNSLKDREQAFSFENVIQFITKPLKQSDIEELKRLINTN
jgi:CheY-like chemotaxis protein